MSIFKSKKKVERKKGYSINHIKVVLYVLPVLYLLYFHSIFVGKVVLGIAGSGLGWLWAAFLLVSVCFCRYLCKDFLVERNGNMALGHLVKAAAFLLRSVIIIYCLSAILFFVATLFAYALHDIKALSQYQCVLSAKLCDVVLLNLYGCFSQPHRGLINPRHDIGYC